MLDIEIAILSGALVLLISFLVNFEMEPIVPIKIIISMVVFVALLNSNQIVMDYDELIGPDQVPHHELIKSGWPMTAKIYWTTCTTFGRPDVNWIPGGVFINGLTSLGLVYIPSSLGENMREKIIQKKENKEK